MKNRNQYNGAIKVAYFKVIKQAKHLIATIEEEPLRAILERQDKPKSSGEYIVHEMINPILYLRLECTKDLVFTIHYGYEQTDRCTKYYPITSAFIRLIYRHTSKEFTEIDIEDCIYNDWVVTNCAELFEYILERVKYHNYYRLKHTQPTIEKSDSQKLHIFSA